MNEPPQFYAADRVMPLDRTALLRIAIADQRSSRREGDRRPRWSPGAGTGEGTLRPDTVSSRSPAHAGNDCQCGQLLTLDSRIDCIPERHYAYGGRDDSSTSLVERAASGCRGTWRMRSARRCPGSSWHPAGDRCAVRVQAFAPLRWRLTESCGTCAERGCRNCTCQTRS